jgi:hypothetical protein
MDDARECQLMGRRSWIVKAKKLKLPLELEGEEWIEVLSKLTLGQKRKIEFAGLGDAKPNRAGKSAQSNGEADSEEGSVFAVELDMAEFAIVRALTWVTDWSFVDENEKPLPFKREIIDQLDPIAWEAIDKALDAHIESVYPSPKVTETPALPGGTEVLPPADESATPGTRRLQPVSSENAKTGS